MNLTEHTGRRSVIMSMTRTVNTAVTMTLTMNLTLTLTSGQLKT